MHRRLLALTAALLTAGCAGHRPAAPTAAAPAARPAANAPAAVPAAVAPPPAPARDASSLRYAAGTSRYRIEQTTHVVQEVMGQTSTVDLTSRQLVSVVATEAAGNLALALTVDSIDISGPAGVDPSALAAARGRTFQLVLAPSGLVVSVAAADTTNRVVQQFTSGLRDFFPRIPASASAGETWTDTVSTSTSGEVAVTTRAVRQHRVVGWEDKDGVRALHITSTSNYSVSGSGEAQGQPIEMTGNGQSLRDAFISAAGVYLGMAERDSAFINANVTSMGLTVPIRQSRRSTVTRLP